MHETSDQAPSDDSYSAADDEEIEQGSILKSLTETDLLSRWISLLPNELILEDKLLKGRILRIRFLNTLLHDGMEESRSYASELLEIGIVPKKNSTEDVILPNWYVLN